MYSGRGKESGQLLLLGVSVFSFTWLWDDSIELKQPACHSFQLQTSWVSPFCKEPLPLLPCLAKSKSEVNGQKSFLCQVPCPLTALWSSWDLTQEFFMAELRQVFTLQHTLLFHYMLVNLSLYIRWIYFSPLSYHLTYIRDLSKNVLISYLDVILHSTFLTYSSHGSVVSAKSLRTYTILSLV